MAYEQIGRGAGRDGGGFYRLGLGVTLRVEAKGKRAGPPQEGSGAPGKNLDRQRCVWLVDGGPPGRDGSLHDDIGRAVAIQVALGGWESGEVVPVGAAGLEPACGRVECGRPDHMAVASRARLRGAAEGRLARPVSGAARGAHQRVGNAVAVEVDRGPADEIVRAVGRICRLKSAQGSPGFGCFAAKGAELAVNFAPEVGKAVAVQVGKAGPAEPVNGVALDAG